MKRYSSQAVKMEGAGFLFIILLAFCYIPVANGGQSPCPCWDDYTFFHQVVSTSAAVPQYTALPDCDGDCMAQLCQQQSVCNALVTWKQTLPSPPNNTNSLRAPTLDYIKWPQAPFYHGGTGVFDTYVSAPKQSVLGIPAIIQDQNGDGLLYDDIAVPDNRAALIIIINALQLLQPLLDYGCDSAVYVGPVLCALSLVNKIITFAAQVILDMVEFNNGMVRYAWQESAWSNTNTILGAVSCNQYVATGQYYDGCNGADDNCDFNIDECNEDQVPPKVTVNTPSLTSWFNNAGSAVTAVANAVQALDDCQVVTIDTPVLSGSCANTVASLTPTDACGNGSPTNISIKLDTVAPTITCSVVAFRISPPNGKMTNVGYSYTATDDCCDPTVTVTVMSDEPVAADRYWDNLTPDAMLLSNFTTGLFDGLLLRAEAAPTLNGRVYTIYATAVDLAGNSATCIAQVQVPKSVIGGQAVDDGAYFNAITQ